MIVDGAVHDVEQIQTVGLPIYARGLAINFNLGPKGQGEVNVPIAVGHCVIFPGDIIVADEEEIVVVPPPDAEEVLCRVAEIDQWHLQIQPVLERGEIVNITEIRKDLEDTGCEFIHSTWVR